VKRTKQELCAYFHEVIDRIFYPELERCIKNDTRYVAALALLSYTEFMGALISEHLGSRGTSTDDFNAALRYFPDRYQDANSELKVEYEDENGVKNRRGDLQSVQMRLGSRRAHKGGLFGFQRPKRASQPK
jgi:hypothetical protein